MKRVCVLTAIGMFLFFSCGREQESTPRTPKQNETTPPVGGQEETTVDGKLIIKPGEGVGELKFGMNRTEMERILGKPERSTDSADEYLSKGMGVMSSGNTGVGVILFGDMNSPQSPLVKACKYKTDKGIGMGSTLKELVNAYGEPSSVEPMGKGQMVSYETLGATFTLMDDKIIHMMFKRSQ